MAKQMLTVIETNSPYADYATLWPLLDSLPDGKLYHRAVESDDGTHHFFSDKPVTRRVLDGYYE